MEQRKIKEREFHDALRKDSFGQRWSPELECVIQENALWANMKYYSIERKSRNFVLDWLCRHCCDKKVLDFCCGNGEDSIFLAKNNAKQVVGIDISEVSIDNCKIRAADEKVSDIASFKVMDAEDLQYDDNTFDVVTEYGALHHVDTEKAFSEIARVLKPDGKAICNEALGHNIAIRLYRKLTPKLRTEFEADHILKKKNIEAAYQYFNNVECFFFHFFTLLAVPFRNLPGFRTLLTIAEFFDSIALRIPILKWQAWQVIFVFSEPIKNSKKGL